MLKGLVIFFFILFVGLSFPAKAESYHFALFVPRISPYWSYTINFAKAACEDLDIRLTVYSADNNRDKFISNVKTAIQANDKPDAILLPNYNHTARELIDSLEQNHIPFILFDEGFHKQDLPKVGKPRTTYRYYLGEFVPDNVEAGADLLNSLVEQAILKGQTDPKNKVQVLAFSGNSFSGASQDRMNGLLKASKINSHTILNEIVSAYWYPKVAKKRFRRLIKKYPHTSVIWAANALMPFGVIDVLKEMKKRPSHDFIIGGINGIRDMEAVAQGLYNVSVGGHFMLGGWSVVMLHDYLKGIDFALESTQMRLRLYVLNEQNIQTYYQVFGQGKWDDIQFQAFSKYHNKSLLKYNFGLKAILKQITQ